MQIEHYNRRKNQRAKDNPHLHLASAAAQNLEEAFPVI